MWTHLEFHAIFVDFVVKQQQKKEWESDRKNSQRNPQQPEQSELLIHFEENTV